MENSKHIQLLVKNEHYRKFIKENNTDKLSRFIRIWCPSKTNFLIKYAGFIKEEIFNALETNYTEKIIDNIHSIYYFNTKSLTKYRLDIFKLSEFNTIINHIAFSLSEKSVLNQQDCEEITNKNEVLELFSRIIYILNDLVKFGKINNEFCIGGTEFEKKNIFYKKVLKYLVGPDGFQKRNTLYYKENNIDWGIYFKI